MLAGFATLNQILTAGIAITAFSLLLYALAFNLRDRVARSFALILACVVIVFSSKSIGSAIDTSSTENFWLHLQWVGIIFLPPAYLHFSDALLSTTGRPSRGRRRWAVRLTYAFSVFLVAILPFNLLVGPIIPDAYPGPTLQRTLWTDFFTLYYAFIMVLAWIVFARAYRRTITSTTRRRMLYLLAGATAPALGSYPYLLFGYGIASAVPLLFWILATITNLLVSVLVVIMAYAVAFFGVPWPDRVVKSRLFKWLMRGTVTASFTLAITTLIRRLGAATMGTTYNALVPIVMVATILLFEYVITLFSPLWERVLFYGKDRDDLRLLHRLEDRLLTRNDLRQFLELVLAAVCDRLQIPTAFVAALNGNGLELVVHTGDNLFLEGQESTDSLLQTVKDGDEVDEMFVWGNYYLLPLRGEEEADDRRLVGISGVSRPEKTEFDAEQLTALALLARRAALALKDRHLQQQLFQSMETLNPQVELIQRLRASSGYESSEMLSSDVSVPQNNVALWVRDALTHYWGGPKLTQSPLLELKVVREAVENHEGNAANALRAILKEAIDKVRPEGERRFTGEWILYNILEMKFLEGRKVREIALRLAMSEADLYRKQRIAIEAVATVIMNMEEQAHLEVAK